MVSLNIYKNSANKFIRKKGFKIENEIEDQDQSISKFIGILTQVFCTFCQNLVILAWTGDELSCREAQNGVTFDFEVKFDLEGQGQSPPKTIGILTKVFYTYGPNLVMLAWTGDELSRGQASDYRTHGRTDTQTDAGNDNTRRPKLASGKNESTVHHYAHSLFTDCLMEDPLLRLTMNVACHSCSYIAHKHLISLDFKSCSLIGNLGPFSIFGQARLQPLTEYVT